MTVYTNQKIIEIHSANRGYKSASFVADNIAMELLSSNAYKLYCYIRNKKNFNGCCWALSSKDACKLPSITLNTYPKAIQELIDKKYLVEGVVIAGGKTYKNDAYHFYELPQEYDTRIKKEETVQVEERPARKFY